MATLLPILCLLLGMWDIPDHGGASWIPVESNLRLTRGGCRCTGVLEVNWENQWRQICRNSVSVADLDWICQMLECGPVASEPLELIIRGGRGPQSQSSKCTRTPNRLGCSWELENCTEHTLVACGEPVKTTPKSTSAPPSTTPEPLGPPRLRLVDGNFSCSGFLELHKQGVWGTVASIPHIQPHLVTLICQELLCGTAGNSHDQPDPGIHLPVQWEAVDSCGSHSLLDCFNRTSSRGKTPAFITCSDSQPRALRRLAAGPTPCEGDIQVFHAGQWWDLCDSGAVQRNKRGQQICRELGCGNLTSSMEIREPPSTGVTCGIGSLHLCQPERGNIRSCSRTRVVCQDSKPLPTGTSAGTISPRRSSASGLAPQDSTRQCLSTAPALHRGLGDREGTTTMLRPPKRAPSSLLTQLWKQRASVPTLRITPRTVTTTCTLPAGSDSLLPKGDNPTSHLSLGGIPAFQRPTGALPNLLMGEKEAFGFVFLSYL
ncbi:PREDICTED: T-cell surface glycoprotein CD5 isoform X1 [Sturnus vulgaris]|uniref:T-cell surface glycoprotein CD5 isoform X1 n=1 Tax=Sturnus vulgaris TaxID=9172 RepID=UPI00071A5C04|nr:PREDICTED: T-cell surface glycoprotein CD5 isoform X1 [Sturnus vulgaris]